MKKKFCRSVLPLQMIFAFNLTQFKSNNKNFWIWQKCLPISLQNPSQLIFYFMNKKFCRSILPLHWFLNSYFAHFRSIINIFDFSIIFAPFSFKISCCIYFLFYEKTRWRERPLHLILQFILHLRSIEKKFVKSQFFCPFFFNIQCLCFWLNEKKESKGAAAPFISKYFFQKRFGIFPFNVRCYSILLLKLCAIFFSRSFCRSFCCSLHLLLQS